MNISQLVSLLELDYNPFSFRSKATVHDSWTRTKSSLFPGITSKNCRISFICCIIYCISPGSDHNCTDVCKTHLPGTMEDAFCHLSNFGKLVEVPKKETQTTEQPGSWWGLRRRHVGMCWNEVAWVPSFSDEDLVFHSQMESLQTPD